jgi:hypothetical protein
MIPGFIVEFLGRASVGVMGTRDANFAPHLHFVSGWFVHDDTSSVVCLVPASFTDHLSDCLVPGGRIALVAEVIGPHETYQLKGSYLDHRPAEASDRPVYQACRQRFVTAVQNHLKGRYRDEDLAARVHEPAIALRFAVEEIFLQTPGPAAGRRVYPGEA